MSLRLAFRVDASIVIGTGHVVRCLSLARALQAQGAEVAFVMRNLPGNMISQVAAEGFKVLDLPTPEAVFDPAAATDHVVWAGVPAARDAVETAAALAGTVWDWLIVDHYAFGREWEVAARPPTARLMVIDDLADRAHECDLLLDQNLGRLGRDYDALVPDGAERVIGSRFALLRPDFAALRDSAFVERKARGGTLRRILIAMGGVDLPDTTGLLLGTLALMPLARGTSITVVMGGGAPALPRIHALVASMPVPCEVLVDIPDMAARMAEADLAIGGAGGTALERCCLGLPSAVVVLAGNQRRAAEQLADHGVAICLGEIGTDDIAVSLRRHWLALSAPDTLLSMTAACEAVTDGRGTERLVAALLQA